MSIPLKLLKIRSLPAVSGAFLACVVLPHLAQAQQAPAPVDRVLDPVESYAPMASKEGETPDFFTTGQQAGIAENVMPLMGDFPDSPTVISGTSAPFVNPNIPPKYVAPPPPPPPAAIRTLGQGRYMILPAESPLLTAPMATLNPSQMGQETETALPTTDGQPDAPLPQTDIPADNLSNAPLSAPTEEPAAEPTLTQEDIANRINNMAQRLETLSNQAAEMDERATAIEQKAAVSPTIAISATTETNNPIPPSPHSLISSSFSANLPYVNDANTPGPKAIAAIKKLAEQLKATPPASFEGWSVTAAVQAPPIGESAASIAQSRLDMALSALKDELGTQGFSFPKTPPAMVVVRTRGAQYLKLTLRPE